MDRSAIAQSIITMAAERGADKSICPSDVARNLFAPNWRKYMDEVRAVAIELQQQGKVVITQKNKPIDINNIKGPIRIKII